MTRAIIVFLVSCIAFGACTQRLICPAYQSAFIYDQDALRKKFSYFIDDSTPKVLTASKNKYLIAEPVSYHKKVRSLQTVEMKPVYVVVPDSLRDDFKISMAEMDSATNSVIDSTYIVDTNVKKDSTETSGEDSIYTITKDKELRLLKYDPDSIKYKVVDVRLNVEQDNYMWYLRNYLVLPDAKLAMQQHAAANEKASNNKAKKGFFGFFKNLFKKKHKEEIDSSTLKPVKSEDDFDYIDTLETAKPTAQQVQSKKKGFLSFLKKDKTKKPKQPKVVKEEVTVPEEEPSKKKKDKKADQEKEPEVPSDDKKEEKDDGF